LGDKNARTDDVEGETRRITLLWNYFLFTLLKNIYTLSATRIAKAKRRHDLILRAFVVVVVVVVVVQIRIFHPSVCCLKINKTGNVLLRYYWAAFVQPLLYWKINKCMVCEYVFANFRYLICCNAHALYCYLWSARLYHIYNIFL